MEHPADSIVAKRNALASGRSTSASLVDDALTRIAGDTTGSFLQVLEDDARERAADIDRRRAAGEDVGPIGGVPIAVKDNICLDRGRTTCASRMLEAYESPFSATAVSRLEAAGAIVIGKTNLDEFAMGSSGEHSAFGPTRNPWGTDRVPGGSSAGSAAAVAAGLVPGALGSDTGGSIRQPASYCGVVGLKPTYGRVSRWGLVAFASSLDQIGPFARTVEDCALLLEAMSGLDALDSTSADVPVASIDGQLDTPVEGLRIGVPREAMAQHAGVDAAFRSAIERFRSLGATIVDVELPNLAHGVAAYYIVAPAEASSNLARYDGVRYGRRAELKPSDDLIEMYAKSRAEGFGPEVQRRIMLGTYALSSGYYDAYYLTALKTRRLIKRDFDRVFASEDGGAGCHAVITPTAPTPAFRIGALLNDPLAMYQQDLFTIPANMAGLPAISVPMGTVEDEGEQMPVGLQIVAPAFGEASLLRIARMYEATPTTS
jgi:aspartyl-tRNA(Asn)/glutamyl-tRNA(Gln) amidotransferase subunit A